MTRGIYRATAREIRTRQCDLGRGTNDYMCGATVRFEHRPVYAILLTNFHRSISFSRSRPIFYPSDNGRRARAHTRMYRCLQTYVIVTFILILIRKTRRKSSLVINFSFRLSVGRRRVSIVVSRAIDFFIPSNNRTSTRKTRKRVCGRRCTRVFSPIASLWTIRIS